MEIILWIIAISTFIAQLIFWAVIFMKLAHFKQREPVRQEEEPLSIIICARNESENLKKNLDRILTQKYRFLEVVVVDDCSTDDSWATLLDFQNKYSILRLIRISIPTRMGKKAALTRGIEASKFENILLTDADCNPISENWARDMQLSLDSQFEIGLAYSPYRTLPGFINIFIRFETLYTAIQYLSFALIGHPYMGVGRNLIYKKSLFVQNNGFDAHRHIASGDDDLFVNQVSNKKNTIIIIQPTTFMLSEPKRSWRGYYRQKMRHFTAGSSYSLRSKFMLGALSASLAGFYLSLLLLLLLGGNELIILLMYSARMSVVLYVYSRVMKKLEDQIPMFWIPILDFLTPIYYLIFSAALFKRKTASWK